MSAAPRGQVGAGVGAHVGDHVGGHVGGHVFTYGSLMFEKVWSRVVSGNYAAAAASLPGFRRQRVRGQDYPSLEQVDCSEPGRTQAAVDGVLYLDVDGADIAALDEFEGADYRRIQVPVILRQRPGAGPAARLLANTYLFIARDKIEPGPWDPRLFERERMKRFLRDYPPPRPAR